MRRVFALLMTLAVCLVAIGTAFLFTGQQDTGPGAGSALDDRPPDVPDDFDLLTASPSWRPRSTATLTARQDLSDEDRETAAPSATPSQTTPPSSAFSIIDDPAKESTEVGWHSSAAFGRDDRALISYRDETNRALKVAHCVDTGCTRATTATIDASNDAGYHTSLAFGNDGKALISYSSGPETSSRGLRVAHCDDAACTTATTHLIDPGEDGSYGRGLPTALVIGTDGRGIVSYASGHGLKVAHCDDAACTTATVRTLHAGPGVGDTQIVIGDDGRPLVVYSKLDEKDFGRSPLYAAHCDDVPCSTAKISVVDDSTAFYDVDVALAPDGLPLVVSRAVPDGRLRATNCLTVSCSSAAGATIDGGPEVGGDASVAIRPDGRAVIAHYGGGNLRVTTCRAIACVAGLTEVVDSLGSVGHYPSVAVGPNGLALISYFALAGEEGSPGVDSDLKVVRCTGTVC